jgi:hypothetical protein
MNEEEMKREFESMFTPAELHPDLAAYLNEGEIFARLQHPLVYGVPYTPQTNNFYNKRYAFAKQRVEEALAKGNLALYVFTHERPYRLNAFCEYFSQKKIKAEDYWALLGDIWQDSENIWQSIDTWRILLRSKKPKQRSFMGEDDQAAFDKLPVQLTVYRGCRRGLNENGMSWTLDRDRAVWFSKRFTQKGDKPCVLKRVVNKKEIFAYLGGRNESEVIIIRE